MRRLLSTFAHEGGQAMIVVVFAFALLTTLAVTLTDLVTNETRRSGQVVKSDASYAAAEAGINDYLSKLVDDKAYYAHYVDPAEATRRDGAGSGTTVAVSGACTASSKPSAVAWIYPSSPVWTYPNAKDRWCQLSNGFEYDLQITPPSAAQTAIQIIATGRQTGSTSLNLDRVIQVLVQPSSLTDYYRVVNGSVNIGATTNGKVYAKGTIDHSGTASASLYSEVAVTGPPTLINGATIYTPSTNPSIRLQKGLETPLNFSDFLASLTDIARAAQSAGIYINNSSKAGFKLTFMNNGTVQVKSCTLQSGTSSVGDGSGPTCVSYTPAGCTAGVCTVPSNGAIYVEQDAIVSGSVKGRVTVASNQDIVLADAINPVTSGQDVIGLIAQNDMYVATYAPDTFSWNASLLVVTGTWQTYPGSSHSGTMTFSGSSTTNNGGSFSFTSRIYNYDSTLQYLSPPWFPSVGIPYKVVLFRELPSG